VSLIHDFDRAKRGAHCPICEKPDWCLVGRLGCDFEGQVICARIESAIRFGEAGWLHQLGDGPPRSRTQVRTLRLDSAPHMAALAARFQDDLDSDSGWELSGKLGLPVASLRRLDVGYVADENAAAAGLRPWTRAWIFPMRDHVGGVTGIRLRLPNGKKLAVKGSRQGLFIPTGLPSECEQLYIAEGESDTAALLAVGLDAIGRPGCTSCGALVSRYVRRVQPAEVVIMGDADEAGRRGAFDLARRVRPVCPSVRVLFPPPGLKDSREWVCAGATAEDVRAAVQRAEPITLSIGVSGGRRS
jgi:hypothetical protein